MKLQIQCDFCGKTVERYPCKIKAHNFCGRQCLAMYSSRKTNPDGYRTLKDYTKIGEHLTQLNQKLNPTRMTDLTRAKLREYRLNTGAGKTYSKYYGKHTHRTVAEKVIGRSLLPGEIVHHVDGDKRNNEEWNLLILPSQSEHSRLHVREKRFWEGGDAE